MPRRVIKQPNGKFACFSSVVDHFIWYDATEEEARTLLREEYMEEIERRINMTIKKAIEDWPPYTQGVPGSGQDRWNYDAYSAMMAHPDDTELVDILRKCGMTDEQILEWQEEIRQESE